MVHPWWIPTFNYCLWSAVRAHWVLGPGLGAIPQSASHFQDCAAEFLLCGVCLLHRCSNWFLLGRLGSSHGPKTCCLCELVSVQFLLVCEPVSCDGLTPCLLACDSWNNLQFTICILPMWKHPSIHRSLHPSIPPFIHPSIHLWTAYQVLCLSQPSKFKYQSSTKCMLC